MGENAPPAHDANWLDEENRRRVLAQERLDATMNGEAFRRGLQDRTNRWHRVSNAERTMGSGEWELLQYNLGRITWDPANVDPVRALYGGYNG